ncbi:MAG: acyl-CoA desaturase [Gemmatimonadales bacterium]
MATHTTNAALMYTHDEDLHEHDIVYPDAIPFLIIHLVCLGAFWSGVTPAALIICVFLYVTRMVAVTAGYHRYFSHRSFKTSRTGQFVLAVLAQTSAQRGAIWWAAKHRAHHKYSDTYLDPHSPRQRGFWFAHIGWIFAPRVREADYSTVPDLTKYPELVWLDRQKYLPVMVLGILTWTVAGWSGLFLGFFLSTVLLYHGSFAINSVAHLAGKQRYVTGDDSRNSWWLAVLTFGEGWHNNHHHYQSSTRQGFHWWQIDVTYYVIKLLSFVGLVWDLQEPPAAVVAGEQRLRRVVVDKVARQLAESFPLEKIADQIREAWNHSVHFEELANMARDARSHAEAAIAVLHMPHIPTVAELKERAHEMFLQSPSLDEIAERSRELMVQTVSAKLLDPGPALA